MKKPKGKDTKKKIDGYFEEFKALNKELEKEEEILEDLVIPQSIKEEEKNLQLIIELTIKFQKLHEHTETIRKNSIIIDNIPEITYPETKGQNKIKTLNSDNGKLIKNIIEINDNLLDSFKIILEKMKVY